MTVYSASFLFVTHCIYAASIPITNSGFEVDYPNAPNNSHWYYNDPPTGWSVYDPRGDIYSVEDIGIHNPTGGTTYNDPIYGDHAPEGNCAVWLLVGSASSEGDGAWGLYQTLTGYTLTADVTYQLTTLVANPSDNCWDTSSDGYDCTDTDLTGGSGFPGYQLQLIAGDTVVAQDDNSLTIPEAEWRLSTVVFTPSPSNAQLGQTLGVRILNKNHLMNGGLEVDFDAITLTTTIPAAPTDNPSTSTSTKSPTRAETNDPTRTPTAQPIATPNPTRSPSTRNPTQPPTAVPSRSLSRFPTLGPLVTSHPIRTPSAIPTRNPSTSPSQGDDQEVHENKLTVAFVVSVEVCEDASLEDCIFGEEDIITKVSDAFSHFTTTISGIVTVDDTMFMELKIKANREIILDLDTRDMEDDITDELTPKYPNTKVEVKRKDDSKDDDSQGEDERDAIFTKESQIPIIVGVCIFLMMIIGCVWFLCIHRLRQRKFKQYEPESNQAVGAAVMRLRKTDVNNGEIEQANVHDVTMGETAGREEEDEVNTGAFKPVLLQSAPQHPMNEQMLSRLQSRSENNDVVTQGDDVETHDRVDSVGPSLPLSPQRLLVLDNEENGDVGEEYGDEDEESEDLYVQCADDVPSPGADQ